MKYLYVYLIVLAYFLIWYVIAQVKKNNGLVDIAWGMGIVVSAVSSLIIGGQYTIAGLVTTGLTAIWGLRLSGYLFIRNFNKEEDFRYKKFRIKWQKQERIKSLVYIFILQSVISYVIALPIILTNLIANKDFGIESILLVSIGGLIFFIGFIFEVLADHSLQRFKKDPNNKGKIMQKNVWKYSRHPNYFGEVTLWWGLGMIGLSTMNMISFIGLIGPAVITYLILNITGIPLLEKRYKDHVAYQTYAKKTSRFFPMIPKK